MYGLQSSVFFCKFKVYIFEFELFLMSCILDIVHGGMDIYQGFDQKKVWLVPTVQSLHLGYALGKINIAARVGDCVWLVHKESGHFCWIGILLAIHY